jgi:hypothetical protein
LPRDTSLEREFREELLDLAGMMTSPAIVYIYIHV